MPFTCPTCDSSEDVDDTDDGRAYCSTCRVVFRPAQPQRLVDPGPARVRRDTD